MGDITERRETTAFAVAKISGLIDAKDYTSAILLSSIYVEMRLRTLITLRLNPPQFNWECTSKAFSSLLGYSKLLNVCDKVGLLKQRMKRCSKKQLKALWEKRCNIAHESNLWRGITEGDEKEIVNLCNYAIMFLEDTIE